MSKENVVDGLVAFYRNCIYIKNLTCDFQLFTIQLVSLFLPFSGFQQTQGPSGARQAAFAAPRRPPRPVPIPQPDEAVQPSKQKPKVPVLEKHLIDQLSTEEQDSLNTKFQEATDAEKKVMELEKEILDAKEKIQFYHAKMQEI
ncbi:hypothetical protein HAX54_033224 [Datura stramonium]|uniref:Uncharacterized protein n=1 Tax=Datura stramonium TaxID=4076 RepID=A0ABS8VD43_DATST|nr:hypothetical protein [Datura stramonium]